MSEAVYCIVDHIIFLNKIKAYKFSNNFMKFIGFQENFLWLLETIFAIFSDMIAYNKIIKKEKLLINDNEDTNVNNTNNVVNEKSDDNLKNELLIKKNKMLINQIRLWSDLFVRTIIY